MKKMKIFGLFISLSLFVLYPFVSQANYHSNFTRPPQSSLFLVAHASPKFYPQQVHVSLAGKDHMRVTYITDDTTVESMVEYGRRPNKYNMKTTGESTFYRYFFYTSGKIHHVKNIGPLKPNTIYYYRCGGHGDEYSFKTPPSTFPIEFAVAGDLGQTDWTIKTLKQMSKRKFDVFLLPGDLSYADTHQPLWDSFGRLVETSASSRPWMVTEGNHEIESFPINDEHISFKAYNARWLMPHAESLSQSNLYYSFDTAGVHTVMIGSYTHYDSHSDQYKWLKADLGKVDRKKTPWLVVVMHTPWYSTNKAHEGEGENRRKALESLLFRAQVDIVFAGHIHTYERFTPVYKHKANPCGPIHITIGDGGNLEGLALRFRKPQSPLSLFRESSFGHGRFRILDDKRAHWTWHRNNDKMSVIADEVSFESPKTSSQCLLHRFRGEL